MRVTGNRKGTTNLDALIEAVQPGDISSPIGSGGPVPWNGRERWNNNQVTDWFSQLVVTRPLRSEHGAAHFDNQLLEEPYEQ